jgi:hypothetical protein
MSNLIDYYLRLMKIRRWCLRGEMAPICPIRFWYLTSSKGTGLLLLKDSQVIKANSEVAAFLSAMLRAIGFSWQVDQGQSILAQNNPMLHSHRVIAMGKDAGEFAQNCLANVAIKIFIDHPNDILSSPYLKKETWQQLQAAFM